MVRYDEILENIVMEATEKEECPLIKKMAEQISQYFDQMAEIVENDEDDLILLNLVMCYTKGMCRTGISFLYLAFSLLGVEGAGELIAIIAATNDEHCMQAFLAEFLLRYSAWVDEMVAEHPGKLN